MRLNTRKALKAITSPETSITVKALKRSDAVYTAFHLHEKEASLNMLALAMVEEQFPHTKARAVLGGPRPRGRILPPALLSPHACPKRAWRRDGPLPQSVPPERSGRGARGWLRV